MAKFIIQGGTPLKGAVQLGGAKNASFKLMIAAALGHGQSRLLNMSKIGDVEHTAKVLQDLGVKVTRPGERTIYIEANGLNSDEIPQVEGEKTRAATLFAGLLLHKKNRAVIPMPGGCSLGVRPIDRHLEALASLNVKVERTNRSIILTTTGLKGSRFRFRKKTHTGTEAMIIAAAVAEGETYIENAGLEPEIDDLILFLNKMGANIKRLHNGETIKIVGVKQLHGAIHRVVPDRNEAVSYACMALATKGDIIVENAKPEHLKAFLSKLDEVGGNYEIADYGIRFWYDKPLKATDITTAPEPGFMTDWQPLWATMMTQAQGTSHIIEAVHNNRLAFTQELVKMGAKIKLYNPQIKNPEEFYEFDNPQTDPNFHAAEIIGPTPLKGTKLWVPDLRGGATLVMAAIIAQGESVIENIYHIDRGYESFDERLRNLSANIRRIED